MNADTASDLRTINAKVRRNGDGTWTIVRDDRDQRVLATIRGKRGAYSGVVHLDVGDGGNVATPTYTRHDDVVEACVAPYIGHVRGERWEFPAPGANDWIYEKD